MTACPPLPVFSYLAFGSRSGRVVSPKTGINGPQLEYYPSSVPQLESGPDLGSWILTQPMQDDGFSRAAAQRIRGNNVTAAVICPAEPTWEK
jgi:hypothetical protein